MVMPSRTVGHARSTLREPPGALLPCLVLSALALRLADGGTVPQHFAEAARGAVMRRLSLRGGGDAQDVLGGAAWEKSNRGYPVLSLPGDHGLTDVEIEHRARVKKVEADLASSGGGVCALEKGPDSNQVHDTSYKARSPRAIDLSRWDAILRVDEDSMVVRAEPMVKMQALVEATLKHGMLPLVLPEFKHITVGGAIMGAALESSSHMHGDFLDACRSVELLLGNSSVVVCSPTERTDLFSALSGSYGTLALLL